jgi:hypothetical protein
LPRRSQINQALVEERVANSIEAFLIEAKRRVEVVIINGR